MRRMIRRHTAAAFFLSACLGAAGAQAPFGNAPFGNAPLVLGVGCAGTVCTAVVPRLSAETVRMGVVLRGEPVNSPPEAVAAVCDGHLAAAIVPRDSARCGGIVGRALFPYYALLTVRAGAPFRHMNDLAADQRPGILLAAPADPTLAALMRANAPWRTGISITADPRAADAFFVVSALDNPLTGAGLTLIAIHPAPGLFRLGDAEGHCMYRNVALDFGGKSPVTTVSVDAVLILGPGARDAHAKGGPRAAAALAAAIEAARPTILTSTRSPTDWRPTITPCHDPAEPARN